MDNKDLVALFAVQKGSGPSGDVTPASIVSATGRMSAAQAAQTLANLGGAAVYPVAITYGAGGWTADKTLAQCLAAMSAGNVVLLALSANGNIYEVIAARAEDGISGTFAITLADGMLYLAEIWYRTEDGVDTIDFTGYTVAREPSIVTDLSSTSITLAASANTEYRFGELTSLTVSSSPASGAYSIVFTSGSTPTVTTFPASVLGLEDFAAEADTIYEINVLDGRAVYKGWPIPVSE